MGLIKKYLGTDHDQLYSNRINSLVGDLEAASEDVVRNLEKEKRELMRRKEAMLDMGVQNRQDISASLNVDPQSWAKEFHDINYKLDVIDVRLRISNRTHTELFEEDKDSEESEE